MATGKDICNQLKKIRAEIAKNNGIDFTPAECNHKEDCMGKCPVCEQELDYLQKKNSMRRKGEIFLCYICTYSQQNSIQ